MPWRNNVNQCWIFPLFIALFLSTSLAHAEPRDVVIDTDAGIDDVIAITYFLKHPDVRVKAITIETNGITHQRSAVRNIHNLLTLLHDTQIPIGCGQDHPIAGDTHHYSPLIMKINDTLAGTPIPVAQLVVISRCNSAEALLTHVLDTATKSIDILAMGPLTTIAAVLQNRPELAKKIGTIYLAGGSIHTHTYITRGSNKTAEWTIYLDPAAAEKVFHSTVKIVLIPLDLAKQISLNAGLESQLKDDSSKSTRFIYNLLVNRKTQPPGVGFFEEPLAAVIATNREIATFTTLPLSVKQTPGDQLGMTYIDKKHGTPIQVAVSVDKKKFISGLIEVLRR